MSDIPPEIREKLQGYLTAIAHLFRSPVITLIVQPGGNASGTLVLGNQNYPDVIAAIKEVMVAEAKRLADDDQTATSTTAERADGGR